MVQLRLSNGAGLSHCSGDITNCLIADNSGYSHYVCGGTIRDCVVRDNFCEDGLGGGICECHGSILNCLVVSNSTYGPQSGGGGLEHCYGAVIRNCTVVDNLSEGTGGGLLGCDLGAEISDCIICNRSFKRASGLSVSKISCLSRSFKERCEAMVSASRLALSMEETNISISGGTFLFNFT